MVKNSSAIERFHSGDQQPYWITETKESICIKIEFNRPHVQGHFEIWKQVFAVIHDSRNVGFQIVMQISHLLCWGGGGGGQTWKKGKLRKIGSSKY